MVNQGLSGVRTLSGDRAHRVVFAALAVIAALVLPTADAYAQCAPAGGPTVTCGTTTNQNPGVVINGGPANVGFGDATQNGFTINVQPSAIVTGSFGGAGGPPFTQGFGIAVGSNNIINLLAGTVANQTQVVGSSANVGSGILASDGNSITVNSNATVTGTSIGISLGNNNTVTNFGTITTAGIGGVGDVYGA